MKHSNGMNPLYWLIIIVAYIGDVSILLTYRGNSILIYVMLWSIVIGFPLLFGYIGLVALKNRKRPKKAETTLNSEMQGKNISSDDEEVISTSQPTNVSVKANWKSQSKPEETALVTEIKEPESVNHIQRNKKKEDIVILNRNAEVMGQSIREWLICTVQELEKAPQDWPVRKETEMEEETFWAYLEVYNFMDYGKGKEKWVYRIGVHRGPEAQIEVYFGLISGSKEDILQYMKEQLQKRCEKEISFLNRLCSKLSEKDEDDFYGDFW